jgi:hypothetical protein
MKQQHRNVRNAPGALRPIVVTGVVSAAMTLSAVTMADVVMRVEGPSPPREYVSAYALELEPHFSFGPDNVYGTAGIGAGMRLGIPLFVGNLGAMPDNLAISFGGDILHYDNCYFGVECGANYLMVPVAAQWNIFVLRHLSVFAEGGAFLYKGWFNGCGPGDGPGCSAPADFGVLPTLALGGRVHFGDHAALTVRVGYPTTTIGLSFL